MSLIQYIFEPGITLYRKTFKRSRIAHSTIYKIMQNAFVPLIEKSMSFYTLPDDPLWLRMDLLTGSYEKETVKLVNQLVKPGMTVLDIGAHVGYYSKLFSKLVGNDGHVIAFEPHPVTFGILCKNIGHLHNVKPVQLAVIDKEGTATLYDCLLESGSSSLHYDKGKWSWCKNYLSGREIAPRLVKDLCCTSYNVKTLTVDSWLEEACISRVDFIKMDIEGAEISAMRGMKVTIESSPILSMIMEFNPRALQSFGADPLTMLQELRETGFSKIRVVEDNGSLAELEKKYMTVQLAQELMDRFSWVNLLCEKGA